MKRLNGRDMVLFIEESSDVFIEFSGLKTSEIEFFASEVITNANNGHKKWRELLAIANKKHLMILGEGLFKNRVSDIKFRNLFFSDKTVKLKVIIQDFAEIMGEFQISRLTYLASHSRELAFKFELQSSGSISINEL